MTTPTPRVTVIGLGYVGLPLAVALAKQFETTGLDIDTRRIDELKSGHDRTGEIDRERMTASSLTLTADPAACPPSDFYIVTVPTPIDEHRQPDLTPLIKASETVQAGGTPPGVADSEIAVHRMGPDTVDGVAPAGTWATWWREQAQAKHAACPWMAPNTQAHKDTA